MNQPIACDLSAIPAAERESHQALSKKLFLQVRQEIAELDDGYAFRFSGKFYPELTRYVQNERHCCPFFHFEIVVNADRGPIWLNLRGPDGIKAFIAQELKLAEQHEREGDGP